MIPSQIKRFEVLEDELKSIFDNVDYRITIQAGRVLMDLYDEWHLISRLDWRDTEEVFREYDDRLMELYKKL